MFRAGATARAKPPPSRRGARCKPAQQLRQAGERQACRPNKNSDGLLDTLSPLLGAALMPLLIKGMFAPLPVPERFHKGFASSLAVRPSQIRAEAQDGATMAYGVASMRSGYPRLRMPVTIIAGADDMVVDVGWHAVRLHEEIPHSALQLVPGAGHMVHHAVPTQVAEAIEAVSGAADDRR